MTILSTIADLLHRRPGHTASEYAQIAEIHPHQARTAIRALASKDLAESTRARRCLVTERHGKVWHTRIGRT